MRHRHLNHSEFTLAAIDDIIQRGKLLDWIELRNALKAHPDILKPKVLRICDAYAADPYNQRHILWKLYAEKRIT